MAYLKPTVSIIVACYNSQSTIARTIDSILAQSFKSWELIIIDDCSTDNSASLIKNYADNDPRIIYLKTSRNTGAPSSPRNIGIKNASGLYIAFVDSDDMWLPDKLQQQIQLIEQNNYDLVYSHYEKVNNKYKRNGRIIKTRHKTTYNDLLKSNHIPFLTSVVKRSAIGETLFKNIPQEDYCFWLDILKKGITAHNLCKVTALYRDSKSSRSANKWQMAHGFWNVIRKHQNIGLLRCWYYMINYTIAGFLKYIR